MHKLETPGPNFIQFLPEFLQLSHVTVNNQRGYHTDTKLLMFPIIDVCSKLVDFKFYSREAIPEVNAQKLLQSITYTSCYI